MIREGRLSRRNSFNKLRMDRRQLFARRNVAIESRGVTMVELRSPMLCFSSRCNPCTY